MRRRWYEEKGERREGEVEGGGKRID